MKKLFRLVNIQLLGMLGSMLAIGARRSRKNARVLYAGIVLFTVLMGGIAFFYLYGMGSILKSYGKLDALPQIAMALASMAVIISTAFKVKGTIFGFKDYDLVMSLPVSTGSVVASRIILLYCINLYFVLLLMVPMTVAYGILAGPDFSFYIMGILSFFLVPMVPVILASILGTIITYVASRFRSMNLVGIIIAFAVLLAYMGFSMTFRGSGEEIADIGDMISRRVNSIYPLAGYYTDAVCKGDFISFAFFAVISVASFLLYSYVIGRVFKKVNTDVTTGRYKAGFALGELKAASPLKALYVKELKRFFSSTVYVLNTGFGIVLLTIGSIAAFFVDINKLAAGAGGAVILGQLLPAAVSFCVVMSCTTASSISLEGRNLWILKSLPVDARCIFYSKILVNLTITAPALADSIMLAIALRLGVAEGVILFLVSAACSIFISLFGLWVNLRFYNLDWTSETVVVKQSAAMIITIFTGMALVGLQFLLFAAAGSITGAYAIYLPAVIILSLLILRSLQADGIRRFKVL